MISCQPPPGLSHPQDFLEINTRSSTFPPRLLFTLVGQILLLLEATVDQLGLADFPRPSQYRPGFASSASSSSLSLHPHPPHAAPSRLLRRDASAAASASSLTRRDDNLKRKPPLSTYAVAGGAKKRGTADAAAADTADVPEAQDESDGSFGRNESEAFPTLLTETHSDDQWERRWDEGWGREQGISRRASLGHSTRKKSGNERNRLEQQNTTGKEQEGEQTKKLRKEEEKEEAEGRQRSAGVGPQRRAPMLTQLVGKLRRADAEPGRGCEGGAVCGKESELAQGDLGAQGGRSARDDALQVNCCAYDRRCEVGKGGASHEPLKKISPET